MLGVHPWQADVGHCPEGQRGETHRVDDVGLGVTDLGARVSECRRNSIRLCERPIRVLHVERTRTWRFELDTGSGEVDHRDVVTTGDGLNVPTDENRANRVINRRIPRGEDENAHDR